LYSIFLHDEFLHDLDELAPHGSRLREQVNEVLHAASANPRGRIFGKLWTFHEDPYEIVVWRAHVGGRSGHRYVHGLFHRYQTRSVDVVPLLLSPLRKDEGFAYSYGGLGEIVTEFTVDFMNPQRLRFTLWDGTL